MMSCLYWKWIVIARHYRRDVALQRLYTKELYAISNLCQYNIIIASAHFAAACVLVSKWSDGEQCLTV
jgi:hypothetical protein